MVLHCMQMSKFRLYSTLSGTKSLDFYEVWSPPSPRGFTLTIHCIWFCYRRFSFNKLNIFFNSGILHSIGQSEVCIKKADNTKARINVSALNKGKISLKKKSLNSNSTNNVWVFSRSYFLLSPSVLSSVSPFLLFNLFYKGMAKFVFSHLSLKIYLHLTFGFVIWNVYMESQRFEQQKYGGSSWEEVPSLWTCVFIVVFVTFLLLTSLNTLWKTIFLLPQVQQIKIIVNVCLYNET